MNVPSVHIGDRRYRTRLTHATIGKKMTRTMTKKMVSAPAIAWMVEGRDEWVVRGLRYGLLMVTSLCRRGTQDTIFTMGNCPAWVVDADCE